MSSNIWISAASPLFFYSPYSAYFIGSPYVAPWTGSLDTSLQAPNNTLESMTGTGSVILPSIYSTSFSPVWQTPSPGYEIGMINGKTASTSWISGQTASASFDSQTWQVVASCNITGGCNGSFSFTGAWVGTQLAPSGSAIYTSTLDDSSPLITYTGFQPLSSNSSSITSPQITPTQEDQNNTLSYTSTPGSSASISFKAASILVTGLSTPSSGQFTATLDGNTATLDSGGNVTVHGVTMYFATNLDTTAAHRLVLTCESGGLVLDSFTVYGVQGDTGFLDQGGGTSIVGPTATAYTGGTSPTQSVTPTSTGATPIGAPTSGGSPSIGTIIGAILGTLAAILLLWFLFRKIAPRLPTAKDKKLNPWDEANLLQNMKNEEVHITTAANQRYVYPGLIAHSALKK